MVSFQLAVVTMAARSREGHQEKEEHSHHPGPNHGGDHPSIVRNASKHPVPMGQGDLHVHSRLRKHIFPEEEVALQTLAIFSPQPPSQVVVMISFEAEGFFDHPLDVEGSSD